jgi:hypothetical protein
LAKYGVNLVRLGGLELFRTWRNDRQAFRAKLDQLHRKVAALKQQGIYVYLDHLFWHTHTKISRDVFPGFGEGKHPIALLFFSDRFQSLYLDFLNELLGTQNPHTGRSLANDPGLALVELQNESSLLFWTFKPKKLPPPVRELVETQFANWLKQKHGSLQAAKQSWGPNPRKGNPTPDDFQANRVGLYNTGMLTGNDWAVQQRNAKRARDQLQFMVETQRGFYAQMKQTLRSRIGAQQLIVPSNWKTADPRVLDALERYTYTAGDVIARNTYFGVNYKEGGRQRFYAIEQGDTYRAASALKAPEKPSPFAMPQVADHPFMITENNWTRPNRYRVEWPMLVGAYASMLGIDGWTFFAKSATDWQHTMGVWDLSNPSVLGQFPAAALMYRRGDVQQASEAVAQEQIALSKAYAMEGTRTVPLHGNDALWQARREEKQAQQPKRVANQLDPLAFFVGPVTQRFHANKKRFETLDLASHIDREQQTVRSTTGQIQWNAADGVVRLNTPRAQGAWGFLGQAGRIELEDIAIECDNEYGSVLAIALDDKPLSRSDRILIQTGTWDQPFGFKTEKVGKFQRITNLGGYPLNVRQIKARVTIATEADEAVVLDGNGYPTSRAVALEKRGQKRRLTLPADAIYTVLRDGP